MEPVSVGDTDADTDTVGATLPLTLDEDVTEALAEELMLALDDALAETELE